ncbi:MAG: DUF362 domain-containing protein [Candidatus Margulisbacteria bacterium]|nr:DUF362 domain-containing protein [Candidatus Margulisiibacteriota bacterium]
MNHVFFSKDLNKVADLFDAAGIGKIISPQDAVALKIHFGEKGNNAYLKSERVKPIVKLIQALGGDSFWTDANTLYKGSRMDNAAHLQTAADHGYTLENSGAPVKISDGYFADTLSLDAKALIAISHFKGHELTGFGGAIKNISMGLASRAGKLDMHSDCEHCKAAPKCTKKQTLSSCWVASSNVVQQKMVEYAAAIIQPFKNKIAFITFICDVSEQCDCYPFNSEPIVPDIGILASFDPVALDQACVDLVNGTEGRIKGSDKFKTLYPTVDWEVQLRYAEEMGLGQRDYSLIKF